MIDVNFCERERASYSIVELRFWREADDRALFIALFCRPTHSGYCKGRSHVYCQLMKRAFDTLTNTFVVFVICLVVCFATCSSANACFNQYLSIFFEDVPAHIDAPVIVETTVYEFSRVKGVTGVPLIIMNARVDKVIKGPINVGPLTIRVYPSSCFHGGVGQGIVVGKLRDDPDLGLVLDAYEGSDMGKWSEEFFKKQTEIWNAWKSK